MTSPNDFSDIEGNISTDKNSFSTAKLVLTTIVAVILGSIGYFGLGNAGLVVGISLAIIFYYSIIINQEYERALVFRLGSFNRVLGPGFNVIIPFLEWTQQVDYRVKAVNVHPQKVLTKDNVTTQVDAIVFYSVKRDSEEVQKAILEVEDFNQVTVSYGKTMLRAEIGKVTLDELLQERDKVADMIKKDLEEATDEFGVEIKDVEIRDVSIPDSMERAMAAQAEAERSRRAKIKEAKGELQAAVEMRAASDILGQGGYKLRTLETLDRVAQENSTVVTLPAELLGQTSGKEASESPVKDLVNNFVKDADLGDLSDLDIAGEIDEEKLSETLDKE